MSEKVTMELTKQQRDILLDALRVLRHYALMEIHEPSSDFVEARSERAAEIEALAEQLKSAAIACETTDVS